MKNINTKIQKFITGLRRLTFTNVIFILLGLLTILIVINLLFNPNKSNPSNENTVVTDPDAEGYQVRVDSFGALNAILPYNQDNYSLTKETRDGVEVINITYDKTDPNALEGAYLYLKQYGLVEGDPRLVLTPRDHIELF